MEHTDAIPLAPLPTLEQYETHAKELLDVLMSGDSDALGTWASDWLVTLAVLQGSTPSPEVRERIQPVAGQVAQVAWSALAQMGQRSASVTIGTARFVIAQVHGFESWNELSSQLGALARTNSTVSDFESAADAIVAGDVAQLERLLGSNPELIRTHSLRRHRATLLHYVSANGVENYRQRTPVNIVTAARMLLDADAEVDAPHWPRGLFGPGTALGLVASSGHPARAGVQEALMETLLDAGAAIDGLPGGWQPMMAALDNACPGAAGVLARRGARMTVVVAAGLGRLDLVKAHFQPTPRAQLNRALVLAGVYGHTRVVEFLLDMGVDLGVQDEAGQTALHMAAHGGHLETMKALLHRGAPLEDENNYGGTVLGQALWSAANHVGGWGGNRPDLDYTPIVTTLIAAGAAVEPDWSTGIEAIDAALHGERNL